MLLRQGCFFVAHNQQVVNMQYICGFKMVYIRLCIERGIFECDVLLIAYLPVFGSVSICLQTLKILLIFVCKYNDYYIGVAFEVFEKDLVKHGVFV